MTMGVLPLWGEPGSSGAQFLKWGVSPRMVAMGDAGAALSDDVYATHSNPAGLAQLTSPEAGFVYSSLIEGLKSQFLAYAHPLGRWGTPAIHLNSFGIGGIQGYDANGGKTGSVEAQDLAVGISHGVSIFDRAGNGESLKAGVTLKWVRETLDDVEASAPALDAGALWRPGLIFGRHGRGLQFSGGVRHLGGALKFDSENTPLPREFYFAGAYEHPFQSHRATVVLDGRFNREGQRLVSIGLEGWVHRIFAIRAGWTSQGELGNGVRFGLGFRVRKIELDYAISGYGPFGFTHRVGMTLRFQIDQDPARTQADLKVEAGLDQYALGRYAEALLDFNEALEVDPTHPTALGLMKKSYEKIEVGKKDAGSSKLEAERLEPDEVDLP